MAGNLTGPRLSRASHSGSKIITGAQQPQHVLGGSRVIGGSVHTHQGGIQHQQSGGYQQQAGGYQQQVGGYQQQVGGVQQQVGGVQQLGASRMGASRVVQNPGYAQTNMGSSRIIGTQNYTGQSTNIAQGSVIRQTGWQESATHQVIKGESVYEQVPFEKTYVEYEPVTRVEYVAVEKKVQDYYTIEHITEHIPQVRYETKIDYVNETITESVPQMRTEYVEEKRVDYVTQKRSEVIPEKKIDYVTQKHTDYVEQRVTDYIQVEKSDWVPVEREEQVPVERTEYITVEREEQVPVERVEMVPVETEEQVAVERIQYNPVERQEEIVDYVPVKKSVVRHPDGRVTGLEGLPVGLQSSISGNIHGSQQSYVQGGPAVSTYVQGAQPVQYQQNPQTVTTNPQNYSITQFGDNKK